MPHMPRQVGIVRRVRMLRQLTSSHVPERRLQTRSVFRNRVIFYYPFYGIEATVA